uniref:Uncharacterized protein n=1 Tax=Romanomermis culicivorax TaxID=13658 RepID=A0A915KLY7_ROMCU
MLHPSETSNGSESAEEEKKKQKDEWNKSPDVSDDKDPLLQPKKLYDNPKRLQAVLALAMKSSVMHRLIELLIFSLSLIYKFTSP